MEKGGLIVAKGHIIGVELSNSADGIVLNYAYLKKRKKQIDIISQGEVAGWQELKMLFGDRIAIALCLNLNKVLLRSVSGSSDINQIIQSALPNVSPEEIMASAIMGSEGSAVGLMRRDAVVDILAIPQGLGLRIVRLIIGPTSLMSLSHLLKQKDVIDYGAWLIRSSEGRIEIHKSENEAALDLGEQQVEGPNVLAFSTAWQHLVGSADLASNTRALISVDIKEEQARVRYELGMIVSVAILAILFLSQILVSNYLDKKEGSLNTNLAAHQSLQQEVKQLESDAKGKQQLLTSLGIDGASLLTSTAWEVLKQVPKGIQLNGLNINPMKKITADKNIQAELGIIRVTGTCSDTREVNDWMSEIRNSEAFSGVRLLSYSLEEGIPNFEIEIKT